MEVDMSKLICLFMFAFNIFLVYNRKFSELWRIAIYMIIWYIKFWCILCLSFPNFSRPTNRNIINILNYIVLYCLSWHVQIFQGSSVAMCMSLQPRKSYTKSDEQVKRWSIQVHCFHFPLSRSQIARLIRTVIQPWRCAQKIQIKPS